MLSYVIRRLLLIVPTLIGITALVFSIVAMSPGGVGANLVSAEFGMRPAEREAMRKYYNDRYGLDRPYVVQYLKWLNKVSPVGFRAAGAGAGGGGFGFKRPDLGESFVRGRSVAGLIGESLPITILLNVVSIPITYGIAVLAGIYAARNRGKILDVTSGTLFLGLWSFPVILAGVLMIGFLANRQYVKWFPAGGLTDVLADAMPFLPGRDASGAWQRGWLLDVAWHLVLPVICLSYGSFAFLSKLARGAVLENVQSDYVRTARAKGVGERDVLMRHVLANSLIPLITVGAHILPALITGSVVVEQIFSINGMGKLTIDAINTRDRELFLSTTLVAGLLGLLGYLLADILYAVADPRVSYE
ncbi:MAG TPA: ABC transporter permease [Tepidisphaeraceae bacterium]|nr:ABC transporter permease [Tepidisphaeraceae bacterium]